MHAHIQIQHHVQRLLFLFSDPRQKVYVNRFANDGGNPCVRIRGGQFTETFDLTRLHLGIGNNRPVRSGLEHHIQLIQGGTLEALDSRFNLYAYDCS